MRAWELVGGPQCGEVVQCENPLWRIVRSANPIATVVPDLTMLQRPKFQDGLYQAVAARDRQTGVLRWQGWK